jgi:pimeloyl-ACP methyl ester carboxylesterase
MMGGMASGLKSDPQRVLAQAAASFSEPDQVILKETEAGQVFVTSLRETYRNGTKGAVYDMGINAAAWGFRLEDIRLPVYLWHGEADKNAPIAMGQYLAKAIPGCQAQFYPGEGHLTVLFNHPQEIFRALVN